MLVSYNWLNKYFDGKLPVSDKVAEALTFHAWEIEEMKEVKEDTLFNVKILPDKAMWALSHRGIAKDLSVILDIPMNTDPLNNVPVLSLSEPEIGIELDTMNCRRFAAARINGVKIGPSPRWLQEALESLGQRSINNVVDASNYVMFDLGQPSHAFDAALVGEGGLRVRQALDGEKLTGLDGIEYELVATDTVIARGDTDKTLSIAGLKGGLHSGINAHTTSIIVEVANWDPVAIRKTGQRLRLRTDASIRYENAIVPEMVPIGLQAVIDLILKVAGGEVNTINEVVKAKTDILPVTVALSKINSVLGVSLSIEKVKGINDRFDWQYEMTDDILIVTPPFERTDLAIAEDVIEEVGRIYGYEHVEAIVPQPIIIRDINQRHYYSEIVRHTLMEMGFSEIFTSSFREKDEVKLANAFAADKAYLRSTLIDNMRESLSKNAPNADLLGLSQIRVFEIGTVFDKEGERVVVALGTQSPSGYKPKSDDPILNEALTTLEKVLGVKIETEARNGIAEFNFDQLLLQLPKATTYQPPSPKPNVSYKSYSNYPAIARDIAMWVDEGIDVKEIESALNKKAGELRVRTTLFDEFRKDGKISYAFRLVFQSKEKTLTDSEVNVIMDGIYQVVRERGWEVR